MKSLNRLEIIIGAVLVLIFVIWSYDSCTSRVKKYQPQEPPPQEQPAEEEAPAQDNNQATSNSNTNNNTPAPVQQPVQQVPVQSAPFPTVFVKIDKLKMRDKPFISGSQILIELPKGAELYYLNNHTKYEDKFTLEGVTYSEPWLEVQTKDGQKRGWVYGGGIRIYQ